MGAKAQKERIMTKLVAITPAGVEYAIEVKETRAYIDACVNMHEMLFPGSIYRLERSAS